MLKLIGHRGLPEYFPENTLRSLREALEAGAHAVECDVQMGGDGLPYLFHDAQLERVTSTQGKFSEQSAEQLLGLSVHEPSRFDERFFPMPVEALNKLPQIMSQFPSAHVFVEIKSESFNYFSREFILDAVVASLEGCADQVVIISFDLEILELVRSRTRFPVAWVLPEYDSKCETLAFNFEPDYLFCDLKKLAGNKLWQGPWAWAVYDVVDAHLALKLYRQGVEWIESWDVRTLKKSLRP